MRIFAAAALTFAASMAPATAQEGPRGFPLDKTYKAISISGFDVQKGALTLTVVRDGDRLKASGSAGCNAWTATAIVRDDQMELAEIVTTRKLCAKPVMKTEEAFLNTLKTIHGWRVDGNRLILEGEAGRLLLTAAAADTKSAKTPAKKK